MHECKKKNKFPIFTIDDEMYIFLKLYTIKRQLFHVLLKRLYEYKEVAGNSDAMAYKANV